MVEQAARELRAEGFDFGAVPVIEELLPLLRTSDAGG
jgi:hypothetical protein